MSYKPLYKPEGGVSSSRLPMSMSERANEIAVFSSEETTLRKNHLYRNTLNREMKGMGGVKTDPNAIRYNHGKHWQDKYEPESSEYYTRLCDGNYHRIGNNMELPEHIMANEIMDMKEQISELEALLKSKSHKGIIEESIISNQVGKLIERITRRHESEAKRYKEMYHVEHNKKIESRNTIKELKAEIEILKATGVFPINTDPAKHASDMKRRFANIGFLDTYTV